jgi:hypothetical protein
MDASPLAVIPLFPWERQIWTGRPFPAGRSRYVLTTFRLSCAGGHAAAEVLTEDITDVHRSESLLERALGLSTLTVHARGAAPLVLRRVRRGVQLAALLELIAHDPHAPLDPLTADGILSWDPDPPQRGFGTAFAALVAVFLTVFVLGTTLRGRAAGVSYAPDDPISPGGEKRSREDIVRFMETAVMPWAKQALAPIKGGADRVTCLTCHGSAAEERAWAMPAVAALPLPDVALREMFTDTLDAQTRNAIYGYIADADNQTKAAYMREIVMPGMARLLHRPAYDFAKPYEYNRTRAAIGCYHCHRVK